MPFDIVFTPSVTGAQTFNVNTWPADPYAGEAVLVWMTGASGFTILNDEYREIDFATNFDDVGATYTVGNVGVSSATAIGRVVGHVYDDANTHTITVTARDTAGNAAIETVSVTPTDPDAETWDREIYFASDANFTGAPAVGGVITHESSWSSLSSTLAAINSVEKVRLHFKRGTTISVTQSCNIGKTGCTYYLNAWGSGANPVFEPGVALNNSVVAFTLDGGGNARAMVRDLDFEGQIDLTTGGTASNGLLNPFEGSDLATGETGAFSMFRCTHTNVENGYIDNGGGYDATKLKYSRFVDNKVDGFQNFGMAFFQARRRGVFAGNDIRQSPIAVRFDAKTNTLPESADHGPLRLQQSEILGIHGNKLGSSSGWSALANDRAPQPCIRIMTLDAAAPVGVIDINNNKAAGKRTFVNYGGISSAVGNIAEVASNVMLHANRYWNGSHGADVGHILTSAAGIRIWNNVFMQSDLFATDIKVTPENKVLTMGQANRSTAAAKTGIIYLGFNTIVSQHTAAGSGVTQDFEIRTTNWVDGTQTYLAESNNIKLTADTNNVGSFTDYGALSSTDDFAPVSGNTAIGAVTSGFIPVRDYTGALRDQSASAVGAHHAAVSSASNRVAPTITTPPVIALVGADGIGNSDVYVLDTQAVTTNVDDLEAYLYEDLWSVGGVAPSVQDATLSYYQDDGSDSGNLVNTITLTNISGVRVTEASNAIAI